MKVTRTIILLLQSSLLLACLLPGIGKAQSEAERDIIKKYQLGQITGMEVTICLAANGSLTPVDSKREFNPGEEIKVVLQSNLRGYVYLVNFGTSGKNSVVFPDAHDKESHLIQPHQKYIVPSSYSIGFDEKAGTESFRVFISRRPVDFLERAVRDRDGVLTGQEAKAFADMSYQATNLQLGVVATDMYTTNTAVFSRAVGTRDPIWNDSKKTALVVIQRRRRKELGEKLLPGEMAVFGVNFKNKGVSK